MNETIPSPDLHDHDLYAWTQQQAELLRRAGEQRVNAPPGLDWEHLAQEIWELGLSIELEIYHRYVVLIQHLLKWQHQPRLRSGSWRGSIGEQRHRIARLLRKSPSLKPKRQAEFEEAYEEARERAANETGLPLATFPQRCPFTLDEAESRDFWPESGPDA